MSDPSGDSSRSHQELDIIYKISQSIAHQDDVPQLLNDVLDIMENDMGLSRATLTLRTPESDQFVIEASRGLSERARGRGVYELGEGITGRVAQTGEPALVPDVTRDPHFLDRTQSRGEATVAFLCVPIMQQATVIGTFSIDRPIADKAELNKDLNFLKLVASLLADSVHHIRVQVEERDGLIEENRRLKRQLGEQYLAGCQQR